MVKPRINLEFKGWFMEAIYGDFGDGSLLDLPHGNFISFSGLGPLTPPGSSSADRGEVLRGGGFVQLCGLDESEAYRGNAKVCLFPIETTEKMEGSKKIGVPPVIINF